MKGPPRKEESLQKSTVLVNKDVGKKFNPVVNRFDESKAFFKARKRKDRQEIVNSFCQEQKVIRSNSEERPAQKKNDKTIRRVSSSEDFRKCEKVEGNISSKSPDIVIIDEECEHERRRFHERFSKSLVLRSKRCKNKKAKVKYLLKTKFKPELGKECKIEETEDIVEKFEDFVHSCKEEKKARSPSPVKSFTLDLDLSTLHEQIDCSEPLLSCSNHQINENTETLPGLSVASNRLLSSPRNSIIATHRIYLDPDIQQKFDQENVAQNCLGLKLQKISKHINSTKKKIRKFEVDFEMKHGHKLSHTDKLNDKHVRRLYMELSKLKKEQNQLTDQCPNSFDEEKGCKTFQDIINNIEKSLEQKRESSKRPTNVEKMSTEELIDEKVAVQKALLYLESIHGRPNTKENRELARPIYDRYRVLKRIIGKIQSNSNGNELATIDENETMTFVPSLTQPGEADSEKSSITASGSDTDNSLSENFHSLTKFELLEQQKILNEERKDLRRIIKLYEVEVQQKTGRMVQKEDKLPMEQIYVRYKKVKAKLKLLDALVGKIP